ncbi:MAG: Hsp20/alpha crystallin family protein [Desulfovermiculus sp.]|nr:Hsp20/alpha crystallin family protein [Desulfovermiculus sp.]
MLRRYLPELRRRSKEVQRPQNVFDMMESFFNRIECSYGFFYRTVPLSTEVDTDKVKAKFKDGILTVNMPKAPSAQKKKIEIES